VRPRGKIDPKRFAGDEAKLLRAATKEAFKRITSLLEASFSDFSPAQQQHIRQNGRPKDKPQLAWAASDEFQASG